MSKTSLSLFCDKFRLIKKVFLRDSDNVNKWNIEKLADEAMHVLLIDFGTKNKLKSYNFFTNLLGVFNILANSILIIKIKKNGRLYDLSHIIEFTVPFMIKPHMRDLYKPYRLTEASALNQQFISVLALLSASFYPLDG